MNPFGAKKPVGVLLFMHAPLAEAFLDVLSHVLGETPPNCAALSAQIGDDIHVLSAEVREKIKKLDRGAGVLIFTDICGATPFRVAQQLVEPRRVALLCGASVPMLVRALTYRELGLEKTIEKALSGAHEGTLFLDRYEEKET
jgi:PTS system ascorbate-specific IIA component